MMLAKVVCTTGLWILLVSSLTHECDIDCLRTLRSQLKDPNRHLSSWEFKSNNNESSICEFIGVHCWNYSKNNVYSIDLGGFGLEGQFPSGIKKCSSLESLNLTGNNISGTLPSDLFFSIPYLVALDLSNNSFSGKIPATWSKYVYLKTLLLDHNRLTGRIPSGLVSSPRLKKFSVAHNGLEGPLPEFSKGSISVSSFEDNPGLCGSPLLAPCPLETDSFFSIDVVVIAVISAAVFFPVGAALGWFCVGIGKEQKHRP